MPRDLFGEVGSPSERVGTRSRYTVPLSLAAHAAVIVAVAAAAVFGPVVLPGLASSEMIYEVSILPPTPPPPAPHPSTEPAPVARANPDAAPTTAPDRIAPEPEPMFEPPSTNVSDTDIVLGSPAFDTIVAEPPPPPTAPKPEAVRAGGVVRVPTKVHDVAPVYPALAQTARVQGMVIIEATVGVDGQVVGARILKSTPLLDEAALAAVRQWRYSPSLLNGSPVAIVMTVTVNFQLQ
jgi:periplasmic protein TonB